jgi:hypothetical protein
MFEADDVQITATATRITRPVKLTVPGDMAMYAALAGKMPQIDPMLADPVIAAGEARRENPWSPMVLSIYLREVCREKAMKINRPELTAWLRRQSGIARRRFSESQMRMFPAQKKAA